MIPESLATGIERPQVQATQANSAHAQPLATRDAIAESHSLVKNSQHR